MQPEATCLRMPSKSAPALQFTLGSILWLQARTITMMSWVEFGFMFC